MSSDRPVSHAITVSGREIAAGDPAARTAYWSFTKTLIAICALKLAEAGTLDLDAPLPGKSYGVRRLLQHRSGLRDYGALAEYYRDVAADAEPWPREEMLARACAGGPLFAPGEGWAYSNIGSMFAREAVEAAAGRPFAAVLDEIVVRPTGVGIALVESRAAFSALTHCAAPPYHPGWVYHGLAAGTARDAALVLHELFTGALLAPATVAAMTVTHPLGGRLPDRPFATHGYATGLMSGTVDGAGRIVGHTGGGPHSVCAVYHFPDLPDPVTVAVFAAGTDGGRVEHEAVRIARAASRAGRVSP